MSDAFGVQLKERIRALGPLVLIRGGMYSVKGSRRPMNHRHISSVSCTTDM